MFHRRLYALIAITLALLVSCSPGTGLSVQSLIATAPAVASATLTPFQPALPTPTETPRARALWIGEAVPAQLTQATHAWGLPLVDRSYMAALRLDLGSAANLEDRSTTWVYALVAPFPTVTDGVSFEELLQAWQGSQPAAFSGSPLLMDESTLAAFTLLWGQPASSAVRTAAADQLVDIAWSEQPSWAIIPFESLEPRWKVLTVDGQSPLHKDFDLTSYPLIATFSLTCADPCEVSPLPDIPATNRDPAKLTTLIMTGVTALVRATAYTMEMKGITYPGRDIGDWLRQADLTHISNEIPFFTGCPYPNPSQTKLVFCSSPRYIELLQYIGADIIELTGNHFADYGTQAMYETLDLYKEDGFLYYGGGANASEAKKPLLIENHGNKLAFIGCNPPDTGKFPTATDTRPGAAPCDYGYMTKQITQLREQGYLPIATFQYYEYYSPEARPWQQQDFRRMADAGAVIVSGSQAHYAQVKEFYHGAFIDYGLGNLFFDQMGDIVRVPGIRREFLDRHVFYDNRYIGTELLTAMLEDYSRPRPMTSEERAAFLAEYFADSGWIPFVPTPTPTITATLTPLSLPQPIQTLALSPAP